MSQSDTKHAGHVGMTTTALLKDQATGKVYGEITIPIVVDHLEQMVSTTIVDEPEYDRNIPFLEDFFEKIEVTIHEDLFDLLPEDAQISFSMRSDLVESKNPVEESGETNSTSEVICSRYYPDEAAADGMDGFEYFILPESTDADSVYPQSIDQDGGQRWHFIYNETPTPYEKKVKWGKRLKKFMFRIYRLNSLRLKAEKIYHRLKNETTNHGQTVSDDDLLDQTILELKQDPTVAADIKSKYSINIYRKKGKKEVPFVPVDDAQNQINPALKTLILIPGTFKRSVIRKERLRKKKRWQGSFKYLMHKIRGHQNWFELLLAETKYEQIITLEHDSVFDSIHDNIQYFIDHLNLKNIRFDQPTTVICASRGGLLTKTLALTEAGKYDQVSKDDVNLGIERIISVACGYTGYVETANREKVKKKLELLFNLLNLISFGGLSPYADLLSFTPNFILRLPGLKCLAPDAVEMQRINDPLNQLDRLWCLPLANNTKKIKWYFIQKHIIDEILGPNNDFVLSFESQQQVLPGRLLSGFDIVYGDHIHGEGLSSKKIRRYLLGFLRAEAPDDMA